MRSRPFATLLLVILLVALAATGVSCRLSAGTVISEGNETTVPVYTYRIINIYPHDTAAFTEGLVFHNGHLYEGTGLYGQSTLRRVDAASGNVLQEYILPPEYFGEGITVFRDTVIQLTWKSGKGFIYDLNSFELLQAFSYGKEGWGITHDGKNLIMSDGTANLYIVNPDNIKLISSVSVYDGETPVDNLNELEYINGSIYANIWNTDTIAIIDPVSGCVSGWVDLSGILPEKAGGEDVLNGIAYDAGNNRLFVTGKLWPVLFEIELVEKQ